MKRGGATHYHGRAGQRSTDQVGELRLGAQTFRVLRGLAATVRQGEVASTEAVADAYAALAAAEALPPRYPRPGGRRMALMRVLQRAWYEGNGGEPDGVRSRREALWDEMRREPTGGEGQQRAPERACSGEAPASRPAGPTVADFVRRGLQDGQGTEAILATVRTAFPGARTGARDVAYYRHQLRKRGALPKKENR